MGEAKRKIEAVKTDTQWSCKTELVEVDNKLLAAQVSVFKPDGRLIATGTCEIEDGDIRDAEDRAMEQALYNMGKVKFQ